MKSILVTTTNSIEGKKIIRYIDAICANVVIGTNILSDFAASFSDIFGGRSKTYQNKLELIQKEVTKELKQKASLLGANAILGFKLDFDEISGNGKSMFMVSASGTACIVDNTTSNSDKDNEKSDILSNDKLQREIYRKEVINKINSNYTIDENYTEFLLENPQIEILEKLLELYIYYSYNNIKENASNIVRILSVYPKEIIIPNIYEKIDKNDRYMTLLTKDINLFDPERVFDLCKQNRIKIVVNILDANKDYYTKSDLEVMNNIYCYLTNLSDTGKIETVKGGILGKEQNKFICENGHKNSPDIEYCENCNLNIKGLSQKDVSTIEAFKEKIDIISELIR